MTKENIASNSIHVELIRFHTIETLVTFETRQQRAHCYPRRVATVLSRQTDNTIIITSCTINTFISRFRLQRIILHYRSLQAPLLKHRYKRQFGSNLLLFTAFKTVQLDSRVSLVRPIYNLLMMFHVRSYMYNLIRYSNICSYFES